MDTNKQETKDSALMEFEKIQSEWFAFYTHIRNYLHGLDGDLSRKIGRVVYDIIEDHENHKDIDWRTVSTAKFLKHDTELWHGLSDSRKK
jgi:hypothetical protein